MTSSGPRTAAPLAALVLLCLAATAAGRDGEPGEAAAPSRLPGMVVSALKRDEERIDVPLSVTAIPGSTVRDAGFRRIRDAAALVPNLRLVEFTARRQSFPFVRGIGSGQGDPAVATYLDGVPLLAGGSTNLPLLNVERIEFLRGPQGTLYGRNALGGLVHVFTRPPPARPELHAEATTGSYARREASLVLGAPLVADRLAASLSGLSLRREGFTTNDVTGHDVDHRDTLFGRGQLLLTMDDRNELRLSVLADRTRDGGFVVSDLAGLRDRPRRISQDFEGVTERDAHLAALTYRREGDGADLVSITSLQGFDAKDTSDFDFTRLDAVRRRTDEEGRSLVQELRVASPDGAPASLGPDADLTWLAGVLAFATDQERSATNELRPGGVGIVSPAAGTDESAGDFRDRGFALFGRATATLLHDLRVGAGLRYAHERKDADLRRRIVSGGVRLPSVRKDEAESWRELLPRIDVGVRISEEVRVYGYAARGFKAGGFNLDAPEGLLAYGPETSWTFEAGARADLLDGRLRIDAAVFRIEWEDMQRSRFDAAVGGYVTNAGESSSRGFEIEVAARPADGLDLGGSFGMTDTELDSCVDPFGENVAGNDLPFAPRTTVGLSAQWSGEVGADLTLFLRGEYAAVGTFFFDPGNRESERFGLAGFRVGVGGERWRLDAWVRNAFDRDYVVVAFQPNPADPSAFVGESGAPRTFGLTFRVDF